MREIQDNDVPCPGCGEVYVPPNSVCPDCACPCTDAMEKWFQPARERMSNAVSDSTFNTWLASLHPHSMSDGVLLVGCPPETLHWCQQRFLKLISLCAGTKVKLVRCGR